MKGLFNLLVAGALVLVSTGTLLEVHAAKYTVWVGFEQPKWGAENQMFIPQKLKIHKGDIVTFKQMSVEPHTVTFHPGAPPPELIINGDELNQRVATPTNLTILPNGMYNGSFYLTSGIMAKGSPNIALKLAFSNLGEFHYDCAVHGPMMNGTISVVADNVTIPSPKDVAEYRTMWASKVLARAPKVYASILSKVPKPTKNADGNKTHYVFVGYEKPPFEFLTFFPRVTTVHPGDVVEFTFAPFHTVSFLAGSNPPDLFIFDPTRHKVVLNPVVVRPANATAALVRDKFISSGLVVDPSIKYRLKIGELQGRIQYECLIHYPIGMVAQLDVKKREPSPPHKG